MNPIDIQVIVNAFGDKIVSSKQIDPDAAIYEKPMDAVGGLPAGHAGALTTRTDENTGVATLLTGHGIQSQDKVDVYWAGGLRYGMTATVNGNAVTIDGGAGDNLPIAQTPLVVTKQVVIDATFTGNSALGIVAFSNKRSHVDFQLANGTSIVARELPAGRIWIWDVDDGLTNPLAGAAVGKIVVSNGDAAAAAELTVIIPYDAVA